MTLIVSGWLGARFMSRTACETMSVTRSVCPSLTVECVLQIVEQPRLSDVHHHALIPACVEAAGLLASGRYAFV